MEDQTNKNIAEYSNESNLKLLSLNEVRKILGIGYKSVTKLIIEGELHAIKINARYKIPKLSLDNYINFISSYKLNEHKKGDDNFNEDSIEDILDDLQKKYSKIN